MQPGAFHLASYITNPDVAVLNIMNKDDPMRPCQQLLRRPPLRMRRLRTPAPPTAGPRTARRQCPTTAMQVWASPFFCIGLLYWVRVPVDHLAVLAFEGPFLFRLTAAKKMCRALARRLRHGQGHAGSGETQREGEGEKPGKCLVQRNAPRNDWAGGVVVAVLPHASSDQLYNGQQFHFTPQLVIKGWLGWVGWLVGLLGPGNRLQ